MATRSEWLEGAALLAARLLLAFLFVVEGWIKIAAYPSIVAYMEAHGVSGSFLPLVIAAELGGGLCVAVGLLTRIAATGLAAFCLLTAILFHADLANSDQFIQFGKNLGLAGGFLLLAVSGAGRVSFDALLPGLPGSRAGDRLPGE